MPVTRKKGAISDAEKEFLRKHYKELSPAEIAEQLGRTEETVKGWLITILKVSPDEDMTQDEVERKAIEKELTNSPEWQILKDEFTDEELRYFRHRYAKLLNQFREGLMATEEAQIFTLIKYEILKHRTLADMKSTVEDIKRLEQTLHDTYASYDSPGDMDANTKTFVVNLENQLASARVAKGAKSTEYNNLAQRESAILKELKATRDQRISKLENAAGTLLEVIKQLQKEDEQKVVGRHMELVAMAVEKERERLSGLHQYADGGIDQPLMTPENVYTDEGTGSQEENEQGRENDE